MKVDQYRLLNARELSFVVPSGMDLIDLPEPVRECIAQFGPYALEHKSIDLEAIVTGVELEKGMEELKNYSFAGILNALIASRTEQGEEAIE